MEITQQFIEELIKHAMEIAKTTKERKGFRGDFMPVAIVVGPQGEQAVLPTPFRTLKEKHIVMAAISEGARLEHAAAVVLVNDSRQTNGKAFDAYFNLPPEPDFEKWKERYSEIVNNRFDGRMENFPAELYIDALLVTVKGPLVKPQSIFQEYKEGVGDGIIWGEQKTHDEFDNYLLKDWWDETPVN